MTHTPDTPLGGFEQRLLGELRAVVELRGAQRQIAAVQKGPSRTLRPRMASRRWVAAVAVLAPLACAAVLIGLSGSSPDLAQAFPIFARPATVISREALASIVSQEGATRQNARLDVEHARAFSTPLGTGYVVTDTRANFICVAAPGFSARGGWAADCGPASDAKRYGAGGLGIYGPVGQVSYVEILPKGATATISRVGGPARPLPLPDGVLTIVVDRPSVITTHIAGRASTTVIRPSIRSARIPVPSRAEVAAPVRLRLAPGPGYTEMTATFRTRYPTRADDSAYVLEYAPLPGTHPRCRGGNSPADAIDEQTTRTIPAGTLLTLRGGAPDCAGRWRVAVYLAVSRGDVHYPGQAWAQPLNGASQPPAGSGDQIVATKTITIH